MKSTLIAVLLVVLAVFIVNPLVAQETPVATSDAEEVAGDIVELTTEAAEVTATTLEGFLNRLVQTPQSDIARVLLILGGVVLLVAGWRIYDVIILIAGFLIGATIATSLVISDSALLNVAILLIGGLIGAALSIFLYYVAVFLIGAYIGIALTGGLAAALALTPVSAIVLLIGGVLGGAVLVGLSFEFLILLSALVGAQMVTLGLGLDAVWTLILTVIGVIAQLALTRYLNYDIRRRPQRIRLFRRTT